MAERTYVSPYIGALRQQFECSLVFVDDGWPSAASELPGWKHSDACVWFVKFRDLLAGPSFDWGSYGGLRVMHDHDAYLSYGSMGIPSPYLGAWPAVFRRNRFDLLVTSGKAVSGRLRDDGVPSAWVPKGYDDKSLHDLGGSRSGVGTYGTEYMSRRLALARVRRSGSRVDAFRSPFNELNATLNRFAACLVCNMFTNWRFTGGRIERALGRVAPRLACGVVRGLEPMIKNFEVAGAGCAPIVDWIDELEDLGFEDGRNVIVYRDLSDLVERLHHYESRSNELVEIGRRAAVLAAGRHTWSHRAIEMDEVLRAEL
jgi:hypothetical protein